jgi:hypothetical protein
MLFLIASTSFSTELARVEMLLIALSAALFIPLVAVGKGLFTPRVSALSSAIELISSGI